MLPGATSIGALVNSIAVRSHNAAHRVFAHPYIDDVVIAGSHGDCAHRTAFDIVVRNIFPCDSGIGSFPDAATGAAHVIGLRIANDPADCNATATAKWPDVAELERGKLFRNRLRFGSRFGRRVVLGRGEVKARGQTKHKGEVVGSIQGVISSCIWQ